MPIPVAAWVGDTFPDSRSLNLAAYTSDGSADNPTGIAFHALRPILYENYGTAVTLHTNTAGSQSALNTSGSVIASSVITDTAGYFGQYTDQPQTTGYYQFTPAVNGSAGDGTTAGGWTLLSHFAAVAHKATQTCLGADLTGTAQTPVAGTRQFPSASLDSTAFFLDLVSAGGGITWTPAVTIADSGSNSTNLVVNSADASGEASRFLSVWAAVSATTAGQAVFNMGGSFPWTAPAGVIQVTATNTGSGAGGGLGSAGASVFGGGGGGGGEIAIGTVAVTPLSVYTVVVPSGGTAGNPGGSAVFTGDSANVTAHGGTQGTNATGSANGTGGAGGTGSSASTHHNGGAGANGKTGTYGGGGGSSAGSGSVGTTATGSAGAPAPSGGGPGGAGGVETVTIVQKAHFSDKSGSNSLTVTMPAPFQAGNSVLAFVYYQGAGPNNSTAPPDPTVTLSDGTALSNQVAADVGSTVSLNVGLYDVYAVSGGQTGLLLTGHGTNNNVKAWLVEVYEVSGLGASPTIDVSSSHTQGPSHPDINYQSYSGSPPTTTHAPELWVAMTGAQFTSSFNINNPPNSQKWTTDNPRYVNNGGVYAGILTASQVRSATGSLSFSGTFSRGVTKGTLAAAYQPQPTTTGSAPAVGPGGGGGGGLGSGNAGGSGFDGQVILNWTAPSGSGYGTPALPAPYATWDDGTSVGTSNLVTVNLNGNTGPGGVLNFLSNPPVFRVSQTVATSVTSATITQIPFSGISATVDSYSGWNPTTGQYTIARDGLYLFHGLTCFSAQGTGARASLLTVNGTSYWGPPSPAATVNTTHAAKTILVGLHAGDVVSLACYHTRGSALTLDTTQQTRMLLVWLGKLGVPAGTWQPPDTTFRWQSGTKPTSQGGNLTEQFQAHLGNDLGFLVSRPYLTAYQTVAQTGLTNGAFSTVTLDTVGGLIHGADSGDNYTGWTSGGSNLYAAPQAGWYLSCFEFFTSQVSVIGPTATAALLPSTSGGVTPSATPDWYQALTVTTGANLGGGAAGVGLHYLSAGETLTPQLMGAGFGATYNTLAGVHAGATHAPALGLVWISELQSVLLCSPPPFDTTAGGTRTPER